MFKTLTTLIRGRAHEAEIAFADANALPILRQQLRDAVSGTDQARRALAVVIAYAEREKKSAQRIAGQLSDLEGRAIEALNHGRDDLATEAASAIAGLEAERDMTGRAIATYETEIARLREDLKLAEQRLRALQRGLQLAEATQKSQRLRGTLPQGTLASLDEAEATLARLQERQGHAEATAAAVADLSAGASAEALSARLAAAGCGAPLKSDAAAVLERLRAKQAQG